MADFIMLEDSRKILQSIYEIYFPKEEKYIIESQIKRAALSICLNLREGNSYHNDNKLRFFNIAYGSLEEVDECLLLFSKIYGDVEKIKSIRNDLEILRRKFKALHSSLLTPYSQ